MILMYKKCGETPLEAIERLRADTPKIKDEVLSYAGRLDPLAEGILLVLVGKEENQNRDMYLRLPKVYEAEILFGVRTDTYDVLGIVQEFSLNCFNNKEPRKLVETALEDVSAIQTQQYPPFSSKTINGIPMWRLARDGKLDSSAIPTHNITVFSCVSEEPYYVDGETLYNQVVNDVSLISGDFRQKEIIDSWRQISQKNAQFYVVPITLSVSSGFYVRSFADMCGKKLGIPALALSIKRIGLGNYNERDITHR